MADAVSWSEDGKHIMVILNSEKILIYDINGQLRPHIDFKSQYKRRKLLVRGRTIVDPQQSLESISRSMEQIPIRVCADNYQTVTVKPEASSSDFISAFVREDVKEKHCMDANPQ